MAIEVSPELQEKLEQITKLPKGARYGILVAICALLGGSYYWFSYQTMQQELANLQGRQLELQRKLSEVRSVAANIGAFEEEIDDLEFRLDDALKQLPNTKELEVLLTDISNLGKTAGVEITSFVRKEEVVHDFYAEVPIAIELEGSYHDIGMFFDLMARLPRIVNMGSINIRVKRESEDGTYLSVKGLATTFRFVGNEKA